MSRASLLITAALLAAPAAARAEAPTVAVAADTATPPPSSRPEFNVSLGLRGMLMPSRGFDPYATNNFLLQGSVGAGITVVRLGNASILLFAEYDGGARSATARGEQASLALHRLSGGAETRYQLGKRFHLAARVAPAAMFMHGSIEDSTLDRPLTASAWTWGLDVSGGGGLLLGSTGPRGAKFYVTLDFGYTFAGEKEMRYAPAASDEDPRKYGSVTLPAMKPAGATSRLGVAVAF
jgi:hypothetical protein